jgi:hypothetical protein
MDDCKTVANDQQLVSQKNDDYPMSVLWRTLLLAIALRHHTLDACLEGLQRNADFLQRGAARCAGWTRRDTSWKRQRKARLAPRAAAWQGFSSIHIGEPLPHTPRFAFTP